MNRTRPRRMRWLSSSLVLAALAACAPNDAGRADRLRTGAAQIEKDLVAYKPDRLGVTAGRSVTWRQHDPGIHTVTSGVVDQQAAGVMARPDGSFDSGELETGKRFSHTFSQ